MIFSSKDKSRVFDLEAGIVQEDSEFKIDVGQTDNLVVQDAR